MNLTTDAEIIQRCLEGQEEAFRILVQRYERPVYNLIWRMVQNTEDARDLTQETFVKAFRALDRFDLERGFSSWISKIASNQTIDFLRRRRLNTVSIHPDPENEDRRGMDLPDDRPLPDENWERGRESEDLDKLIARLAPHYRIVVHLRHVQQRSYEEISEILELPLGTVKARLHRAHGQLRSFLLAGTAQLDGQEPHS